MKKEDIYIYDIETYKSLFCATFLNPYTNDSKVFVIDEYKNDRFKLISFCIGKMLVGYNNKTFDNVVINRLFKGGATCLELFQFAQDIINSERIGGVGVFREFKEYMYNDEYRSIDLMRLLFSKKLRVSLKALECSLNHYNVEELPYPIDTEVLSEEQKQNIIHYNMNDCEATVKVYKESIPALEIRKWMLETYGIDAYSMDGVNGGIKILEYMYQQKVGNNDFKKLRTPRNVVPIKDVILSVIKFKTQPFKDVLEKYKQYVWTRGDEDDKFLYEPLINDFRFKFSTGGIHGYTQPGIYESDDKYQLISIDVASYYPSMTISWKFCPQHLNTDTFIEVYDNVRQERLRAKHGGEKLKNETLKLTINGTFGNYGNEYSWLYDNKVRLQICVNGQLFLAMLIESLFSYGDNFNLIDANTDGIYIKVKRSFIPTLKEEVNKWEKISKVEMEYTNFNKLWFETTADYFGIDEHGKVKAKGGYITDVKLGKGMEFPIINIAVKKYFLERVDYVDFVKSHNNILDFCSFKKLRSDFICYWGEEKQQRINRFYASKAGKMLTKQKLTTKESHMLKDSPVILYNKFDDKTIEQRKINYDFYISKIRKIVNLIEGNNKQLSLF